MGIVKDGIVISEAPYVPDPDPFTYVAPTPASVEAIKRMRTACRILAGEIGDLPFSRERSLALTKLEEVSMWANKAIVFHQDKEGVSA